MPLCMRKADSHQVLSGNECEARNSSRFLIVCKEWDSYAGSFWMRCSVKKVVMVASVGLSGGSQCNDRMTP